MNYKLSIITINKNNAEGLRKTCLSVVTQTYKDFEWIIIDGASEDNSVEIIKQYSDNIDYWVSEPDTGIYNAMNKGIKIASGEYLLFLNSGDYILHPWTLQDVIDEIAISETADVYYSDVITSVYKFFKSPENVNMEFFKNFGMINHQNCLIKHRLFEQRLYNERYRVTADWYFFLQECLENNITFLHIKTNIAVYDINGITGSSNTRHIEKSIALNELNLINKKESFIFIYLRKLKYFLPYGIIKLYNKKKDEP